MSSFDADAIVARLKGFQRDAVEHVIDRYYGAGAIDGSGRFLVADETGLGKSIVARGVIARTIEHLKHDASVDRIDIVYICSNADLAKQNLQRLNVTGDRHISMATRLTLLARDTTRLNEPSLDGTKKVNLVSFTPGTSFKDGGWRSGSADERAMLAVLLDRLVDATALERHATRILLQGTVKTVERFTDRVTWFAWDLERRGGPDERIVTGFDAVLRERGTLTEFVTLRERAAAGEPVEGELWHRTMALIGSLRQVLAKASVDALEPDLVILDEFQRFRTLLDPTHGEASELADSLFSYENAKVLLLSATPYKPFTAQGESGEDHARDFLETVRFLAARDECVVGSVADALGAHREALVAGSDGAVTAQRVRVALLPLMSRSERPPLGTDTDMVIERPLDGGAPTASEVSDWIALQRLGDHIGVRIEMDHWKSIPYFATFMETYKSGSRTRELLEADRGQSVAPLLARTASVTKEAIAEKAPIEFGNGMLRALARDTLDRGWWKLLWVPATMRYLKDGPIYSSVDRDMTKHVVFSAWSGVPTAISSLLSHEAERLATRGASAADALDSPDTVARRLSWRLVDGRPAQMNLLALFWPHPELAERGDVLAMAREHGRQLDAGQVAAAAVQDIRGDEAREAWEAFFSVAGAVPDGVRRAHRTVADAAQALDEDEGRGAARNLVTYVRTAVDTRHATTSTHPDLGHLATHSPGSIAYRAVCSVAGEGATAQGIWAAAWRLSLALRSLFDRPISTALLDTLGDSDLPYWRRVIDYCADGNLQAVLDEYMYQLRSELGGELLDDDGLARAAEMASRALRMTSASLRGHDNTAERNALVFRTRFAVRYGGQHTDADAKVAARQADVRAAFNSPFAPFVLVSTSVGQEGIDFHGWSHAVVHWNLPSNPVDFEQREGRVHRFMGHAVRKNVAMAHWEDVLHADSPAWEAAMAAAEGSAEDLGEFAPWWIYPGPARIHRRVATLTLAREHERYDRLVEALALYRLTLGQPRQEDMLRLLQMRGHDGARAASINLRPPQASASQRSQPE